MATNPHIPPVTGAERKEPQLVPNPDRRKPQRRKSAVSRVATVVISAVALLAVILYLFLRNPNQASPPTRAQASAKAVPGELQLGAMQLIGGPTGGFYLDGQITNTGPHDVTTILAEIKLRGAQNEVIQDVIRPVEGMALRKKELVPDSFANDPIKPNQTRPFRINVDQVPNSWNNNLPEVRIADVTATGTGK